jgi:hypothetical protein
MLQDFSILEKIIRYCITNDVKVLEYDSSSGNVSSYVFALKELLGHPPRTYIYLDFDPHKREYHQILAASL